MDAPLHPGKIAKGAAAAPATRQKSCNACVRGKRRCDKKAPRCTRCSTKSLECVYARVPPGAPAGAVLLESDLGDRPQDHQHHHHHQHQQATVEDLDVHLDVSGFCDDLGSVMDMPSLAGSSTTNTNNTASPDTETGSSSSSSSSVDMCLEPSRSQSVGGTGVVGGEGGGGAIRMADLDMPMEPDMSTFSIADLLAQSNPAMDALWNLHDFDALPHDKLDILPLPTPPTQPQPQPQPPPPPQHHQETTRPKPLRDVALLTPGCESCIDPLLVHDPRSRPGFIIQFFAQLHATFARTRALPFLHPRLYTAQLPAPILAAFSAANAYANRTPETRGWTVKLVADAVRDVHAAGAAAATPLDKLARLQALVVLNAIRTLDGDIALRAASEKEWHVMRAWLVDLTSVRDELEGEPPQGEHAGSRDHPPESWESWLLLENIRRTVMITVSLICLVAILKSELSSVDSLWRQCVHYTASRHLWDAQSSLAFYRAWRGKPRFLIRNLDYNDFWQYGTADDLDEFTRVMLTVQAGVDGMEYFVSGESMPTPAATC